MKNPTACKIIDALGGTGAVARLCEIKPPSVCGWRELGIPKAQYKFLELARPEVFRVIEKPRRALSVGRSSAA